jgi:hypothetical protein
MLGIVVSIGLRNALRRRVARPDGVEASLQRNP